MKSMTKDPINYHQLSRIDGLFEFKCKDLADRDRQRAEEFERYHPGYTAEHSPKTVPIHVPHSNIKEYATQALQSIAAACLATYAIFHSRPLQPIEAVKPANNTHSTSIETLLK